jgi:hypothetical protein
VLSNPVVSGPKGVSAAKIQLGPGKVGPAAAKPANFQFVKLGNKVAPVWKSGPKKIWWGGGWKTFVPFRRAWCGGDRRRLTITPTLILRWRDPIARA